MISFYTYRGNYLPRTPEILLAEFRNQIVQTVGEDRESLAIACSTPDKFGKICNLTNDQVSVLVKFAKNQKVAWQIVLMTLGSDLQTKVDVVLGYDFPRYIKSFLLRLNIPTFDLAEPDNQELAKKALLTREDGITPDKLVEHIIQSKPRRFTSDVVKYDQKNNKFYFEEKLE